MVGSSACMWPAVGFTSLSLSAEGVNSKHFALDVGNQIMQGEDTTSFAFLLRRTVDKLFFQM